MAEELRRLKKEFEGGRKSAIWEAVIFCDQTGKPKPAWLRNAVGKFARDRVDPNKNKGGRPNKKLRDIGISVLVDYIREERRGIYGKMGRDGNIHPPGSRAKPKRLPPKEAFKQASEILSKDLTEEDYRSLARILAGSDIRLENIEKDGEKLQPSTIERVYKRARKKYRKSPPINPPSKN